MPKKSPAAKPTRALNMTKAYKKELRELRAVVRGEEKALAKIAKQVKGEIAVLQAGEKRARSMSAKKLAAVRKRIAVLDGRNS